MGIKVSIFKSLQLAILGIIILISLYGYNSIHQMNNMFATTVKMFNHPLTVSNAVRDLNKNALKTAIIIRHLSKITDMDEANEFVKKISTIRADSHRNYFIIKDRYLGPLEDIDKSEKSFNLSLVQTQLITSKYFINFFKKDRGLDLDIENLENLLFEFEDTNQVIIEFATGKANQIRFQSNASGKIDLALLWLGAILFILFTILIGVVHFSRESVEKLLMIDKNILTLTADATGKVLSISNALARKFRLPLNKLSQNELVFFVPDEKTLKDMFNTVFLGDVFTARYSVEVEGDILWFDIHIEPKLNFNFKVVSLNIIFTDVSIEKKIEEVSIKDSLTGLFNRNYFEIIFEKEIKKAIRDKKTVGMLMLDIDYFKQYNDTYGHLQGDHALKLVSNVLTRNTKRSYDLSFRIGGEEFVVLFNLGEDESLEACERYANKIREEILNLQIEHESSLVNKYVTISIGCLLLRHTNNYPVNEIYNEADKQLYIAKDAGRNKVSSKLID